MINNRLNVQDFSQKMMDVMKNRQDLPELYKDTFQDVYKKARQKVM